MMSAGMVIGVGLIASSMLASLYFYRREAAVRSNDVLNNLALERDEDDFLDEIRGLDLDALEKRAQEQEESLLNSAQKRGLARLEKTGPLMGIALAVMLKMIFSPDTITSLLPIAGMGAGLGFIYARRRVVTIKKEVADEIFFMLPLVMERVVMAVQAGLDVIAAVNSIVELEKKSVKSQGESAELDIVTRLLARAYDLSVKGLPMEQALRVVSSESQNPALRHAFLYLAQAHQEGGALVRPLRELSDSTQLYYQETVEEKIAKLPVKATAPLIVMFAGLIALFITPPLLQILNLISTAASGLQ